MECFKESRDRHWTMYNRIARQRLGVRQRTGALQNLADKLSALRYLFVTVFDAAFK